MQNVKRILKGLPRTKEAHLSIFESEWMIKMLKDTARRFPDKWDRERILDEIRSYDRMQSMGLTNIATLRTAMRELVEVTKGSGISQEDKDKLELKNLEREFIGKKLPGFFPTPEPLINNMLDMCSVYEGETILEPSAGLGHIATAIRAKYPQNSLSVIEFSYQLWEVLEKKGFDDAEHINFLATTHKYDVIFMNPPFENHQDIDHVRHAYSLLKPGGRLVAIMAGNKKVSNQSKVREFMEMVDDRGYFEQNESGAFKSAFRSTGVSTITVYLEKPGE